MVPLLPADEKETNPREGVRVKTGAAIHAAVFVIEKGIETGWGSIPIFMILLAGMDGSKVIEVTAHVTVTVKVFVMVAAAGKFCILTVRVINTDPSSE